MTSPVSKMMNDRRAFGILHAFPPPHDESTNKRDNVELIYNFTINEAKVLSAAS